MANKQPIDLSLPLKGYDENWAYKAQPEGTSPSCLNVRPYDVLGQRLRGGQRAGISKYIALQPNGAVPIQMLVQEPLSDVAFIERFAAANGTGFNTFPSPWAHYDWTGAPWFSGVPVGASAQIQSNSLQVTDTLPASPTAHVYTTPAKTGDMTVSMTVTHSGVVDESSFLGLLLRVNGAGDPGYVIYYLAATSASAPIVQVYDESGAFLLNSTVGGFPQAWATAGAAPGQTTQNTPVRFSVSVAGAILRVYLNSVLVGELAGVGNSTQKLGGFVVYANGTAANVYNIDDFAVSSASAVVGSGARILTCSGGSVYSGIAGGAWSAVGAGMNVTGIVRGQAAFQKIYLCDGVAAHYSVYDPTTQTMSAWVPTAGSLPTGAADTSLGATIIALYRGRIALSGIADDPQNWFMSKAGDPLDWDYGATPSAVMAVAGNNSIAGLVGDRITCLAPANDDLMVMGGDHSVWMMRGDPADGGRIDNVSTSTGVAGPDAITFDPQSVCYFFGNGVLWRLTPDGQIAPLSRGRLDKTLGAIDLTLNNMRLVWDAVRHGLHIFVTPHTSGASTHYWWDARTDGFWPEAYPNALGPTAACIFDSNAPNDRAILLGGQDGYVREINPTAVSDDGTTILSRVKFGPMTPGNVHQNARLSRVITVLESSSNPVALRIFAAQSPEEVVAATVPAFSYQVSAVNRYATPRVGGNSLLFELKNDSFSAAWATGTAYVVGSQVVAADGVPYISRTIHTSTTGGAHPSPTGGANPTDWTATTFRTWAVEGVSAVIETTGRTRHGRI